MEAILDGLGPVIEDFGELVADGLGIPAIERVPAIGAGVWPEIDGPGQLLRGDQLAGMTLVADLATRRLFEVGLGGGRLTWSGSVDGDFEELDEFRLSRASRAAIRCSWA